MALLLCGETERRRIVEKKSLFLFSLSEKGIVLCSVICLSLPVFNENIFYGFPKTNKAFTGLERHGGKWLMTTFSVE